MINVLINPPLLEKWLHTCFKPSSKAREINCILTPHSLYRKAFFIEIINSGELELNRNKAILISAKREQEIALT